MKTVMFLGQVYDLRICIKHKHNIIKSYSYELKRVKSFYIIIVVFS